MGIHRWLAVLVVGLTGSFASAQEPMTPQPALPGVLQPATADGRTLVLPFGMIASAGGGVTQFIGAPATDQVRVGGAWTARLELGSRTHVGGEVAYLGSIQGLTTLNGNPNGRLFANGIGGQLRVNILTGLVQPYLGAGLAYQHYSVGSSAAPVSDATSRENVVDYTGAAGAALRWRGFVVDARVSLLGPISGSPLVDSGAKSWNIGAAAGWEF
jgi:hypothetical protein